MGSTYSQLIYHFVFSTKHRTPSITPELQPRLYDFMGGIIRDERGTSFGIGGMPDHVHLLVRWRTDESIAYLLRNVKSRSSGWVHETFRGLQDFGWQDGYAAFSVSKSQSDRVKLYIVNQAEHHKKQTFQEELVALLDAHGVDYDPRYLWD